MQIVASPRGDLKYEIPRKTQDAPVAGRLVRYNLRRNAEQGKKNLDQEIPRC
ncbi:MAG TPA: hypothetical protein PLT20_01275 [Sedimentisphaerales bacterium]|nr:hypothetical protein [Sedimentisphaerales bacterium]